MPFRLIDAAGRPYDSPTPGTLGGHRRTRIYGRLDCRGALAAIARGGYVQHRVFFADEATARAAGYLPCARCLPAAYARWKQGARRKQGAPRQQGAPGQQGAPRKQGARVTPGSARSPRGRTPR
jgi:Metal binding domain of Ada